LRQRPAFRQRSHEQSVAIRRCPTATLQKGCRFYVPSLRTRASALRAEWSTSRSAQRQPSLLFAGLAYREPKYIALWRGCRPIRKHLRSCATFPSASRCCGCGRVEREHCFAAREKPEPPRSTCQMSPVQSVRHVPGPYPVPTPGPPPPPVLVKRFVFSHLYPRSFALNS